MKGNIKETSKKFLNILDSYFNRILKTQRKNKRKEINNISSKEKKTLERKTMKDEILC